MPNRVLQIKIEEITWNMSLNGNHLLLNYIQKSLHLKFNQHFKIKKLLLFRITEAIYQFSLK